MDSNATYGGITRSGTPGSFTYTAKAGFANKPVTFVSFYDSLRFANWLNNGQGSASTETGAYTLNGGTDTPSNALAVTRNGGANIFLTSENEWYKAAYYSAAGFYFDYPTGSNLVGCVPPNYGAGSAANCGGAGFGSDALTTVGAYVFSASPYGTYDQGGNVWEWNEELVEVFHRGIRGGGAYDGYFRNLAASSPSGFTPSSGAKGLGFRVASLVPEPGTGLLVMSGVLGMALRRKRTAKAL
jgi:formylglycine-generating enzyme required for sulfatase activity